MFKRRRAKGCLIQNVPYFARQYNLINQSPIWDHILPLRSVVRQQLGQWQLQAPGLRQQCGMREVLSPILAFLVQRQ